MSELTGAHTRWQLPSLWLQTLQAEDLAVRHEPCPVEQPVPTLLSPPGGQARSHVDHGRRGPVPDRACRWCVQVAIFDLLQQRRNTILSRAIAMREGLEIHTPRDRLQEIVEGVLGLAGSRPSETLLQAISAEANNVQTLSVLRNPERIRVQYLMFPHIVGHAIEQRHYQGECSLVFFLESAQPHSPRQHTLALR